MENAACHSQNAEDEGFGEEQSEEEEEMDTNEESTKTCYYTQRISMVQYEKQRKDYTKLALEELINSPEYQRRLNTCSTCWNNWREGNYSKECQECGGFGLTRPCPICQGKCNTTWHRNIEMSHSRHEAFWEGDCGLPWEEQQGFMYQLFTEADEDTVLDGMQDLSTR